MGCFFTLKTSHVNVRGGTGFFGHNFLGICFCIETLCGGGMLSYLKALDDPNGGFLSDITNLVS